MKVSECRNSTGWSARSVTCTRSDVLAASASYPVLTVTVDVAGNAAASVTNSATVSGGGEFTTANDSASDVTTINFGGPQPTTTTMAVAPANSVSAGSPITLTATVLQSSNP